MSQLLCPDCGAELEDDFGLVECASCGAQVLVGDEAHSIVASEGAEENLEESIQEPTEEVFEEFSEGPVESPLEDPAEDPVEDPAEAEVLPDFMADESEESEPEEDFATDDLEVANPLSDIESFANEELSTEGSLVYDLIIEGVDTPEIRNALVEILKDSKFQWDIEELVASIKLGVLNIYSLNPVKAYMVITQARRLPIKLAWKQRSSV